MTCVQASLRFVGPPTYRDHGAIVIWINRSSYLNELIYLRGSACTCELIIYWDNETIPWTAIVFTSRSSRFIAFTHRDHRQRRACNMADNLLPHLQRRELGINCLSARNVFLKNGLKSLKVSNFGTWPPELEARTVMLDMLHCSCTLCGLCAESMEKFFSVKVPWLNYVTQLVKMILRRTILIIDVHPALERCQNLIRLRQFLSDCRARGT